ncbi:OmpA family protein [Candidatus Deianiraea vastatrix]|uniref:Peptidoglycan-associated lipoprotein n=1 Tax=Candidatus Deianiraea vastatrix TaxID=2163644 RepID=A0A5B8XFF8_9RICK|nr:OmpA family protein [Candidatus Deianiraea vastatrix]QED23665.1 Putative peptidoglycan-associated lipoprotein [Candidatus Deianiraea vastatrix]
MFQSVCFFDIIDMKNYFYLTILLALVASCGKNGNNKGNKEAYGHDSKVSSKGVNSLSKDSFVPDRVFFDFDSSAITHEGIEALKTQAEYLKTNKLSVVVEGHADERGTDAYNLALGLKRAKAVKAILVKHGVQSAKIKVVTFGKQKIEFPGDSEEVHAKNRRSVTVVAAKK